TAVTDRGTASADRVAGAGDRGLSGRDRGTSLADRVAGAIDRDLSGRDRGTSSDDREASAADRRWAAAHAELKLEIAESEARAWRLLQTFPESVVVVNAAGIIELVNTRALALFGYQPGELIGQPVEHLVAGLHQKYRAHRASCGAGSEPGPLSMGPEVFAACKDGSTVPVEVHLSGIALATGPAVLATIRDVSDRRLADAERRISDERFRVSFENAPVGMAMIDLHRDHAGRFLQVNAALCALTGHTEAQLLATTTAAITHPDDRGDTVANVGRLARGTTTRWDTDKRYTTATGTDVWVHLIVSVVHDGAGHPSHGVCQVEDITTRKAAEAALRHARHEAERANAAKDEFLSRLSHELRTPLNAVLGFAQLLERDDLSPKHDGFVGHILRGGRHLLAMIDDVLDVTAIDAGRLDLRPENVDVDGLLCDLLGLMQPLATANHVLLRFTPAGPPATRLTADPHRLRQVLINLLSNAIKYNQPGGTVDVTVDDTVDVHGHCVSIAVIDTGLGIPAADLPRLFTAFDRLGRESTAIEGTGIGLALSQRLVTLMSGRLEVKTATGTGSTFTVTLPGAAAPRSDQDSGPTVTRPDEVTSTSSLLYIEDNPSDLELVANIIGHQPRWTLTHAMNAGSGLALARAHPPTAIVLDLHLPDINGAEILHILKSTPTTSHIPVAILSADANPRQITRLLTAGAHSYLTKPLEIIALFDFLHDATTRPRPAPTLTADAS
ncbi:MAG: PAS domain S-box protein, partial [Actinomycetota bacterium]|nr:PAS domain S-box protein [Actinomycetota bacterium]